MVEFERKATKRYKDLISRFIPFEFNRRWRGGRFRSPYAVIAGFTTFPHRDEVVPAPDRAPKDATRRRKDTSHRVAPRCVALRRVDFLAGALTNSLSLSSSLHLPLSLVGVPRRSSYFYGVQPVAFHVAIIVVALRNRRLPWRSASSRKPRIHARG